MKDTRDFIIDEAYKLFLSHSYEAVSISVISEAIGFTKGALYHHFKNKEELFRAVIDKHFPVTSIMVDVDNTSLKEYTTLCIEHTHKILKAIFGNEKKFILVNYLSLIADCFRHYVSKDHYAFMRSFTRLRICPLQPANFSMKIRNPGRKHPSGQSITSGMLFLANMSLKPIPVFNTVRKMPAAIQIQYIQG